MVDLGSTPGAWSQYVRRKLAPEGAGGAAWRLNGTIIALDILPMEPIEGRDLHPGRLPRGRRSCGGWRLLAGRKADVVVSDMAPNLSGIGRDAARIEHLVELASISQAHLKPEGALVCKVFHGSGYSQLVELFKKTFRIVKLSSPRRRATSPPKPSWWGSA